MAKEGKDVKDIKTKTPWGRKDKIPYGKCKNDPQWYYSDEVILKDAANFSFANMLGMAMDLAPETITASRKYFYNQVPGILTLSYLPGVGNSDQTLTQASNMIYTFNRSRNSGSANYEAPDYTMYLLAHINAQAALVELSRIYGLLNTFSRTNFYKPKALLRSLGFNYDNLKLEIVDFRAYINNYILRLRSLAFPNVIKLADKYRWMTQHIFKDSDSSKAQLYAFNSVGWYRFTGTKYVTGSALEFMEKPGYFNNLTEIRAYYDQFIDALLTDSDIAIMSGDTMKAYGDVQLEVPLINEGFVIEPTYELEALVMIQNAEPISRYFVGFEPAYGGSSGDIVQLDGRIQYNPKIVCDTTSGEFSDIQWWNSLSRGEIATKHLITMPVDNPTAADTMVATRLMVNKTYRPGKYMNLDALVCEPSAYGDSIVLCLNIFVFNSEDQLINIPVGPVVNYYADATQPTAGFCDPLIFLSKFDWAPKTSLVGTNGTGFVQDVQNFAELSESDIAKAHAGALIGLLMPR